MKKNNKAFTLVELVITITLIIILTSISVPRYKNYSLSAKKAEGYALLGAIRDAQKQYKSEYATFFSSGRSYTANHEVLGIDARTNKYFTNFCVGNGAGAYYFTAYVTSRDLGAMTLSFNLSATTGAIFE